MTDAGAALYIPIDSGRKYLAVAHPDARVEGRTSSVPSQLAATAVVGGVADARRSLLQFSMLRLWWLAVVEDPTLASRQSQLRELLAELPDHAMEQARTEKVLAAAGDLKTHHRVLAPRKHREVATGVHHAQLEMHELPWKIVDVRRTAELESEL